MVIKYQNISIKLKTTMMESEINVREYKTTSQKVKTVSLKCRTNV